MDYDHQHAARLLAKCAAYIKCNKPETARRYALELMAYLGAHIDEAAAQPSTATEDRV